GVDLSSTPSQGSTVRARIMTSRDIGMRNGTVTLSVQASDYDYSYIGSIPSEITIDGGFSDWTEFSLDMVDDVSTQEINNIDITKFAAEYGNDELALYMDVDGIMLGGTSIPYKNSRIVASPSPNQTQIIQVDSDGDGIIDEYEIGYEFDFDNDGISDPLDTDDDNDGEMDYTDGGEDMWLNLTYAGVSRYIGPPEPKEKITGEDNARIYLDSDNNTFTGFRIGNIGAEYLIEVSGKHNKILNQSLYSYDYEEDNPWVWEEESNEIDIAIDSTQIELSIPLITSNSMKIWFQTTDWSGAYDEPDGQVEIGFTNQAKGGTRAGDDNPQPAGSDTALICYSGTTATIDGDYSAAEWEDADYYDTGSVIIYTKHDGTYAYFAMVALHDTTPDENDYGIFVWDTAHDAGTAPQTDDNMYTATRGVSEWAYTEQTGDGSIWDSSSTLLAGEFVAAYDSGEGYMVYEARVLLTTLNSNGNFDADEETIGFAGLTVDGDDSSQGVWPSSADSDNPSTWGDLEYSTAEIPEFQTFLIPLIVPMVLIFYRRKK
ncbi:MAG: hypothetical protein KAJ33_00145, partial [Thermoplasmata archaeon]|nr:hypothetical protein [Thermoplasmata archaeon]